MQTRRRLQTSGARLAGPPIGALMTDTLMTNAWRATHRRLDRILKLFFIVDVFGTFIGVIDHDAWFTIVCLVAALSVGMIAMSRRESVVVSQRPKTTSSPMRKNLSRRIYSRANSPRPAICSRPPCWRLGSSLEILGGAIYSSLFRMVRKSIRTAAAMRRSK